MDGGEMAAVYPGIATFVLTMGVDSEDREEGPPTTELRRCDMVRVLCVLYDDRS